MRSPDNSHQVSNVKRDFTIGLIVASLLLVGFGMVFYARLKLKTEAVPISTTTPKRTEMVASPTPTPILTLEILNGSGVSGLAAKAAQTFSNLGYTVTKTGNAPTTKTTTILVSDYPLNRLTDQLINDIAPLGPATISGKLTGSSASAQIIIGKDWPKPSATP